MYFTFNEIISIPFRGGSMLAIPLYVKEKEDRSRASPLNPITVHDTF